MDELISVIIPVYRVEEFLPQCVESVLAQTYRNLEILLVDDGSPDGCPAICDAYAQKDSRVRVLHQANGGVSAARNAGLSEMRGDYVIFIDSDDYVDGAYIDTLYRVIKASGADIAICAWRDVPEKAETLPRETLPDTSRRTDYETAEALRALLYQVPFDNAPWCKLYRAEVFQGLRFPEKKVFEDFAILYRVFDQAKRVSYLPYCGYRYRLRSSGTMRRAFDERKMALIDFADEMKAFVLNKYPQLKAAVWSRFFRANCHIYLQIPDGEQYRNCRDRIASNLRLSRCRVLCDRYSRIGTRGAALICIFPGGFFLRMLKKWTKVGKL